MGWLDTFVRYVYLYSGKLIVQLRKFGAYYKWKHSDSQAAKLIQNDLAAQIYPKFEGQVTHMKNVWVRLILVVVLMVIFLMIGRTQPRAVLLDAPFGLAYYIAERLGRWRPGPLWVGEHPAVETFCFLVWPLLVSFVFALATAFAASALWLGGAKYSRVYAVVLIIALFVAVLAVRVQPGYFRSSYFGHWAENY